MATGPTPEELRRQQDMADSVESMEDTYRSIAVLLKDMLGKQKEIEGSTKKVAEEYSKDLTKTYRQLAKDSLSVADNGERLLTGSIKSKEIQKQITDLTSRQSFINTRINQLKKQGVEFDNEDLRIQQDSNETIDEQLKTLQSQLVVSKQIERTAGLTAKIFEGIKEIPLLNKFIDVEKVTDDIYKNAAKSQSAWKSFGAGISSAAGQLSSKLKDPLVQFSLLAGFYGKIIKAAYTHNELITKLGKQLGISKENAQGLYDASFKYASSSKDSFVTATLLAESQTKLNESLGVSVNLGNENAEVAARLTHFYGLSEDSSGKIVELGVEQGKNGLSILNSTAKTYTLQKAQYGGSLSFNKVLDKVANVSSDIYVKFKGNTQAIAQAVMEADRLGLSLEQVDKIGESILNFESSIESELKAELLTGKQINLEKARQYALSGDTANLTKEIAKQVGNIHQFEKMNVIQRKAYAEAMGMSVQEMSSMLRKQEFEAKLTKEAKESAKATLEYADKNGIQIDAALRAQYEQKSLADEQKETFKKLNEILGKIVEGPMSKFLHLIETILHKVNSVFEIIGSFTGGTLGSALGALLLGAPLMIGAFRMLSGGVKALALGSRGSTPANPQFVYDTASGSGTGGGVTDTLSNFGGGKGKGKFYKGGQFMPGGGRAPKGGIRVGGVGKMGGMLKGLGGGAVTAAIGIGAGLIADQMEEGGAQDAVSGIGTAASYAGTGAMIGSIIPGVGTVVGGVLGGVVGGIKALFDAESNAREREQANKEKQEAQQKSTNDLLAQFLDRPIHLNMNNETILKFNTNSNLYGTQQSIFN
jgi:hypothetical protein